MSWYWVVSGAYTGLWNPDTKKLSLLRLSSPLVSFPVHDDEKVGDGDDREREGVKNVCGDEQAVGVHGHSDSDEVEGDNGNDRGDARRKYWKAVRFFSIFTNSGVDKLHGLGDDGDGPVHAE